MIRLDLSVFAQAANTTAEQSLNILGEMNMIIASGFPFRHPFLTAVMRFVADPVDVGSHTLGFRFIDGNGNLVWSSPDMPLVIPPSDFAGLPARVQAIIPLIGLPFPEEGPYVLEPYVDGHRVSGGPEVHAVRSSDPATG